MIGWTRCTRAQYEGLGTKKDDEFYYISDEGILFLGEAQFQAPGLCSAHVSSSFACTDSIRTHEYPSTCGASGLLASS